MTLSEELSWRGFVNQTTYKDIARLDGAPIAFYWGVDPSSDSMTIGNLAAAMMVRHFIDYGHHAFLLVGGATGMIGDPDGKAAERNLLTKEDIEANKRAITAQYRVIFAGKQFDIVDNYDWFKDMTYLDFLRDVGKHSPMRQMLGREFVQSRLGEEGSGISYAEFSYSLIQGYDYLWLHQNKNVDLQVCGADQWGNSITGVDLIRRLTGDETHVWSTPLIINQATGLKFGKSEGGAVWLDPNKTSPTAFYQFWINCDDQGVSDYMRVYTLLDQPTIEQLMAKHHENPALRLAQRRLAEEVTMLVHGEEAMQLAKRVTDYLTGSLDIETATLEIVNSIKKELPSLKVEANGSIIDSLTKTGLSSSNGQARQLLAGKAITINGQAVDRHNFEASDFKNSRLLIRRGKAFKDSALIEI